MASSRGSILAAASARRAILRPARITGQSFFLQARNASSNPEVDDPHMNGGYENPPAISRQMRDPHADWWDKQERKNFGEPVHEDNDIMGVFALEQYPGQSTSQALFQIGCFISAVLTLCGVGYFFYPDKPSYPREFPGGLEKELGGPKAMTARKPGDPLHFKGD